MRHPQPVCAMKSAPVAGSSASPTSSASADSGGAAPPERLVRIDYTDGAAREVFAVGSFNGWNPRATPFQRLDDGRWTVELRLAPGEYRYRLLVDHEWRDDPRARRTAPNPYGGVDAVLEA